jgi:hypothetical protein
LLWYAIGVIGVTTAKKYVSGQVTVIDFIVCLVFGIGGVFTAFAAWLAVLINFDADFFDRKLF